ncbi:hypothetical protein Hanom_Chr16g01469171 [Helianthus anomalus]
MHVEVGLQWSTKQGKLFESVFSKALQVSYPFSGECSRSQEGGYHVMRDYQMNMVTALVLIKKYNFSHIVFHYMVENIMSKSKTWIYPRFIQMILDHAYPELGDENNDMLVQYHMDNESLKQLVRYHPKHPEPKTKVEFFGFIKD